MINKLCIVLCVYLGACLLHTEPTPYCDDEMTEFKQLKTEKDDMAQDTDIIKTRRGVESKTLGYLQPVPDTMTMCFFLEFVF